MKEAREHAVIFWSAALWLLMVSTAQGQMVRDLTVEEMHSEQRLALVIGNGQYDAAPLRNPANDARATAAALRLCGFEVMERIDVDYRDMYEAVRDFGRHIQRGGVGVFYFAGHGIQVDGQNYLIPIGADVQSEDEVPFQAIPASLVLEKMETARNRVNIVILDACRNNPFARSFRSSARGLDRMDAATGSLLSYATAPGRVAADGEGDNSVYTEALLKYLLVPGLKIEEVFKRVRQDVMNQTDGSQIPWESSSMTGNFYFRLPAEAAADELPPRPSRRRPR